MHFPSANLEAHSQISADKVPSDDFFGFDHQGQWACLSRDQFSCNLYVQEKSRSPKIIGDNNDLEITIFPWSILFTDNKQTKGICSGVLISSRNVLTSALCSRKIFAGLTTADAAVGGVTDFENDDRQKWDVKVLERRFYHPDYDQKTGKNNVGILRTFNPFSFTEYVKPVRFGHIGWTLPEAYRCITLGYDNQVEAGSWKSSYATVQRLKTSSCQTVLEQITIPSDYFEKYSWSEEMDCYTSTYTDDVPDFKHFNSDNGGALMCYMGKDEGWYLHGVVAGIDEKNDGYLPVVVTRTDDENIADWILEKY